MAVITSITCVGGGEGGLLQESTHLAEVNIEEPSHFQGSGKERLGPVDSGAYFQCFPFLSTFQKGGGVVALHCFKHFKFQFVFCSQGLDSKCYFVGSCYIPSLGGWIKNPVTRFRIEHTIHGKA